jgi:hypothetical protein
VLLENCSHGCLVVQFSELACLCNEICELVEGNSFVLKEASESFCSRIRQVHVNLLGTYLLKYDSLSPPTTNTTQRNSPSKQMSCCLPARPWHFQGANE